MPDAEAPFTDAPRSARYEIRDRLGLGSMGAVFRAFDRDLEREVALKSLRAFSPQDLRLLKREFRSLVALEHPNIARFYELEDTDEHTFVTLELIEGDTFVEFARRAFADPREGARRVRRALGQVAAALVALHRRGFVHRDVKPSNVLVDRAGRAVLLDFGLLIGMDSRASRASQGGAFVGTLAYMAPEQARGEPVSASSDWYALGVMIYEALTGRLPYQGSDLGVFIDPHRDQPPRPSELAEVPTDLETLALDLLAFDPSQRPAEHDILGRLGVELDADLEGRAGMPASEAFVNREGELAILHGSFEATRGGRPASVRIEGTSGVGKSELIRHFLREVEDDPDALVLSSRCHPSESVRFEALDGVVDELSRFLVRQPPDRIRALRPRHHAELQRVFPVLARVDFGGGRRSSERRGSEPHEVRRRAFGALRELLGRISDERPCVVWIDDLQWGNPDSAPLLRELVAHPDAPPLLLITSYRIEDRAGSELIEALIECEKERPGSLAQELSLHELNAEDGLRLLEDLIGSDHTLTEDVAAHLVDETGGSPFLIGEVARAVAAQDVSEVAHMDLGDVTRVRLGSLSQDAERLLHLVCLSEAPIPRGVAFRAAGLGGEGPDAFASLRSRSLLRETPHESGVALFAYHDRLREQVVERLEPAARQEGHRDLLEAFDAHPQATPDALLRHALGAGDRRRAGLHAAAAGDEAVEGLAFLQAGDFYAQALELLDPPADPRRELLTKRGEALTHAGRGRAAGESFEQAAALAGGNARLHESRLLRSRAAEQYLVSGFVERGVGVLAPLLTELGLPYPSSSGTALLGTLAQLPRLLRRFRRLDADPPKQIGLPDAVCARIDTCHTAAKGLVVVDPLRGTYFSVRSLVEALAEGQAWRVGRGLSVVGASMAPIRGPLGRLLRPLAGRMLRRSRDLAQRLDDPYLQGMASISMAQESGTGGRWQEMFKLCDVGTRQLRDECRGVTWEIDVGTMGALRAQEELGRIPELRLAIDEMLQRSRERGDRYGEVTALLYDAYWQIAGGELTRARETSRHALELWGRDEFDLQSLYALRIEAVCDVYEGLCAEAWARVEEAWPAIQRAGLLQHEFVNGDALILQARAALAAATARPGTNKKLVTRADAVARQLTREPRRDLQATGRLLAAGIASLRGDGQPADEHLAAASEGFAGQAMPLAAAYAELRRSDDARVNRAAEATLHEAGIAEPQSWLSYHAPGFQG